MSSPIRLSRALRAVGTRSGEKHGWPTLFEGNASALACGAAYLQGGKTMELCSNLLSKSNLSLSIALRPKDVGLYKSM